MEPPNICIETRTLEKSYRMYDTSIVSICMEIGTKI